MGIVEPKARAARFQGADPDKRSFRISFLMLFGIFVTIVPLAILVKESVEFGPIDWETYREFVLFIWPVPALLAAIFLSRKLEHHVTRDGLGGFTLYSSYRFVEWDAITEVSRIHRALWLGLKGYRIDANDGGEPIYLTMMFAKPLEFEQAIRDFAPGTNPLRAILR